MSEPKVVLQFEGSFKPRYSDPEDPVQSVSIRVVRKVEGKLVVEWTNANNLDAMGVAIWRENDDAIAEVIAAELVRKST